MLRCSLSVALEALARWDHPAHGLQGPFVFITIAEESGLIVPLGAAMLRQACEQLRAWRGTALGGVVHRSRPSENRVCKLGTLRFQPEA